MTTPEPQGPLLQLGPGIYMDANGNGIINAAEVLALLDLEDTPEARQEVMDVCKAVIGESWPPERIFWRPPGDPRWRTVEES